MIHRRGRDIAAWSPEVEMRNLILVFAAGVVMCTAGCDFGSGSEEEELPPGCDGHAEGESWDVECNTCSCSGGEMACTLLDCDPVCEGGYEVGESWDAEDGCNSCVCEEGGIIACTALGCVQACEDGHLAGETWAPDSCNTCWCTDSLEIECTLAECTCEDGHLPGESWDADDGCNTCTCTEDLEIACTKMACPGG